MKSNEIRHKTGLPEFWLREIAAQLAEINENLFRLTHSAESKLMDAVLSSRKIPQEGLSYDNQG